MTTPVEKRIVAAPIATIEQRIARILIAKDATSAAVGGMIGETEAAIISADKAAETIRRKSLDIAASPDADHARDVMQSAEFGRDRLKAVLPKLEASYQRAVAREAQACWEEDYQDTLARRDQLAAEFREFYEPMVARLADLITGMTAMDEELSRVNREAPMYEPRRLRKIAATPMIR